MSHPTDRVSRPFEPAAAAVVAFAVYAATSARDVQWGDPAKLALYVWRFNLSLDQDVHLGSLVWAWPFSHLPFGSFAFRVTLASVCASAMAVGFLHAVLLKQSASPWAARTGTASFVVSHTFWFVSTIPESYPVSVLCAMVAAWLALNRNRLWGAGVVLGAGALANALTLFGIPAAAWWLWRRHASRGDPWRFLAGIAVGIGVPVLIASSLSAGSTASTATEWWRVLRAYINWRAPAQNLPLLVAYFVFNFVGPAMFLIATGVKHVDRDDRTALLIFAAVHYGIALFYLPQRAYLIPIPLYLAAAWLVAQAQTTATPPRERVVGHVGVGGGSTPDRLRGHGDAAHRRPAAERRAACAVPRRAPVLPGALEEWRRLRTTPHHSPGPGRSRWLGRDRGFHDSHAAAVCDPGGRMEAGVQGGNGRRRVRRTQSAE